MKSNCKRARDVCVSKAGAAGLLMFGALSLGACSQRAPPVSNDFNAGMGNASGNDVAADTKAPLNGASPAGATSEAREIRIRSDTLICLRQRFASDWLRATGLLEGAYFMAPVAGEFSRVMRRGGQPLNRDGSARIFVEPQPSTPAAASYAAGRCDPSGGNVTMTVNVAGLGAEGGYRVTWELRQGTGVARGAVERASLRSLPWPLPPNGMNPHDNAIRHEIQLIATQIAPLLKAG